MAITTFAAPAVEASDPLDATFESSTVNRTSFGTPRLTWSMPPVINLQPQRARLMLNLPSEWMPEPDIGFLAARGISLVPQKEWEFHRAHLRTKATIGPNVVLRIQDRAHSLDFGLRLMPRSAVAVLRFDPTAGAR